MTNAESNFTEETKTKLIKKLRFMTEQCLTIVGQEISGDLKDDKLFNALKAKRQAAEDAVWASEEVDRLTNEINQVVPASKKDKPLQNLAERHAE